jgi:hypothetical protein
MRKLTPLFLLLGAFFLVAVAVGAEFGRSFTGQAPAPVHLVKLASDHAEPAELIVEQNEVIRFAAADGIEHVMVGSGDVAGTDTRSPTLRSGDDYNLRIPRAGTYHFHDELHPAITVRIIVFDPSK